MKYKKKSSRAYALVDVIGLLITIAGLIVTIIVFPNWQTRTEIEVKFAKNNTEKITSYYNVYNDSLRVSQSRGDSTCVYSIYLKSRSQISYEMVVRDLYFTSNETWNGETYSLSTHLISDIRFKVKKTAGLNTGSTINLKIRTEE